MSKRAIIYARVSTDDQRGNYSIPTQIDECNRYAVNNGYMVVGDLFVDPVTGQDTLNKAGLPAYVDDYSSREITRPGINAALTYLENVGFDIVIVFAIDRLARDPFIRRTLELDFERLGASVKYVIGNYDQSPEGEVRKDLEATFGKWENAKRVERCQRGKRGKAEIGLFVGGRSPYGYIIDREAFGGLAVNDDQAVVVQQIFDLYVHKGYSIRAIADMLTAQQVVNHSGNTNWGKSSIARILRNPTYAGTVYYNKSKRTNYGRKLTARERDDWIAIKVEPLVEQYIFNEAQSRLSDNRERWRKQPSRFYLLSGLILCAECKRPYFAQTKVAGNDRRIKDGMSYRHRIKHGHCRNKHVSADRMESAVWNAVVDLLLDTDNLTTGYELSLKDQKAKQAKQRAALEQLNKDLIRHNQRLNNLTTAYTDPDIQMAKLEYLAQRRVILGEISTVQNAVEGIECELELIPIAPDYRTFAAFSERVRSLLEGNCNPTLQEKRELLQQLHVTVYIDVGKQELSIEGWLNAKEAGLSSITY